MKTFLVLITLLFATLINPLFIDDPDPDPQAFQME